VITSLATTAPTQFLDIGGTRFAYRRFGTPSGTPLVFTQHFMGNLDNFDPAISDALAPGREIILFDNAGVGRSTGTAPDAIAGMAADAARFIDGLGRAFISRITARTGDRDTPVSDQTIAAYRAAARGWASAPADNFGYLDVQPHDTGTPA